MAKRLLAKLFLLLVLFVAMVGLSLNVDAGPAVPAVYLFGDSTFDVGTNNFLQGSTARADMKFYGIDFPNSESSGRFSNGFNTADAIVRLLGYNQSPPPFLYLLQNDTGHFKREILKGVNFASGGSGLLDATGSRFKRVISMAAQIQQFTIVHSNISEFLNNTAEARFNNALFLLSVGSNDIFEFFNVTFHPNETVKQEFLNNLTSNYQTHLKNLVNLGARKFGILSVPPLGCVPLARLLNGSHCMDEFNAFAQIFQTALEGLLQNLSSEFPDFKYSLAKSYEITIVMIDNPAPFGLKEVVSACCGNSTLRAAIPCGPDTEFCEDRRQFLFWDQYHPTEAASKLAALSLFTGGTEFASPTNFSQLVSPS